METANKLELHYFLADDSHAIDAFVRHRCEAEFLTIAKDLFIALGYDIDILSEAPTEGGFKDFWKFVKKNKAEIALSLSTIALLVQITALILTRIPVSNSELERLQRENLQLDLEEKRLRIEKLKIELTENKATDTTTIIQNAVAFFDSNYKVIKHKSNFYQILQSYSNVNKISTSIYNDTKEIGEPKFVDRADFHKFILLTNELPEVTIENAIIEIVSPVLKNGKYKWKGIYEGGVIDFTMKDSDYKKSVTKKEITFHSGFYIETLMKINRVIDDTGIIQNRGYSVVTVIGKVVDNKIIETEQGKRYKKVKEELSKQTKLF